VSRAPERDTCGDDENNDPPLMPPSLLIVEDDAPLRDVLVRSLRAEGFTPRAVANGRELLERALAAPPDALVIDIGLPDADGRDLCQALRAGGVTAPVLFLTARDALTDRLSGFTAGGDDYLTKPFDIEELVARLHALVRRSSPVDGATAEQGLTLDPSQHSVSSAGCSQPLTPTEFRLLAALAARPGKALNRRDLIRTAWPHGAIVQDNTLDVYIARIRRKLGALPDAPTIKTLHGLGYRLQ
jgi:two-component system, OmpR family, response regulator